MQIKRIMLLGTAFTALLISCASKSDKTATEGQELSVSLDDYVIFGGESGSIRYRVVDYAPIEAWFLSQSRYLDYETNYKEIEALYDALPMIGDTDNLDGDEPQRKKRILDDIIPRIYNGEEVYTRARENLLASTGSAMEETSRYINQLFPELAMDLVVVLNPFFPNGGMGVINDLPDGSKLGRLEMGVARGADGFNTEEGTKVLICHELTHVIHQYFGAAGLADMSPETPGITMDLGLFTEGLATYVSGEITGIDNVRKLLFSPEYSQSGPIDADDFVRQTAMKYREEMLGKPYDASYRLWFGTATNPEDRPFPQYEAIGYFLGYYAVQYLVENNIMSINDMLKTPALEMQEPIRMAVGKLAEV